MTVENDTSRIALLAMLDQIESLLADVRTAIVHDSGNEEHE